AVESRFGVRLTVRRIFEELPTLRRVAEHVARQTPARAPEETAPPSRPEERPAPTPPPAPRATAAAPPAPVHSTPAIDLPAGDLHALFARQLDAFSQLTARQIEALGRAPVVAAPPPPAVAVSRPAAPPTSPPAARPDPGGTNASGPAGERQARFLAELAARYNQRTAGSKRYAARYRPVLADLRWYYGFRPSTKEMVYPLIKGRARGSRIWDVDGNEYVDLTLGYGVHLLGHAPPVVEAAVRRQLDEGFELGPRSPLAGEAAELLCEITGFERATFCVSGTEAVLLALRLARAATGRTRFVMFEGAYHGHGDATQMRRTPEGGGRAEPSTPGVPAALAADAAVFEYGSEEALSYVEAHGRELAAVLVEPVRSRFPELQPADFLHRLRELTAASGTTLIFDEMITGFRVHPAGAQGVFGIRADLATYGKILGGGLPMGAVAGAARFLDRMDGGAWRYGDASQPDPDVTYFGATHALHPLSMAAAKAVLQHLRAEGPGLQEDLNRRTDELMERLDTVFRREEAPIRMVNFGSLFRFEFAGNRDPLFYLLAERGVYVWEGRTCFLSTAHTAEDLDHVVAAVEGSVPLLRQGGFLPPRRNLVAVGDAPSAPAPAVPPDDAPRRAGMPWQRRRGASLLAPRAEERPRLSPARASGAMDFSLFYFGSYDPDPRRDKYRLLLEGARFADTRGFSAVWIPERHFHAFGGLSPNPSVVAAALARETRRIGIRAGSVVLPLHHPVRVAEEWSVVDNLSGGRAGISIASGWHAGDFVLDPGAYAGRRDEVVRRLELVRRLWRGEAVPFPGPDGRELEA
ncbi:MAG: MupA/Atu3671 family FMN-dependent luciferase-like monooxygenase, partial [Thermoanaerobaculia bacterium]